MQCARLEPSVKKQLVTKEEKLTRHPWTQRQDQVAFCKLASHASFTPFESVVQHVLGPYLQYKRDRWQQTTQAVVIGRNDVQRTWLDPLGTHTRWTHPVAPSCPPLRECSQCMVLQQVRRHAHIPYQSLDRHTSSTLRGWLWQHSAPVTRNQRLSRIWTPEQYPGVSHETK